MSSYIMVFVSRPRYGFRGCTALSYCNLATAMMELYPRFLSASCLLLHCCCLFCIFANFDSVGCYLYCFFLRKRGIQLKKQTKIIYCFSVYLLPIAFCNFSSICYLPRRGNGTYYGLLQKSAENSIGCIIATMHCIRAERRIAFCQEKPTAYVPF